MGRSRAVSRRKSALRRTNNANRTRLVLQEAKDVVQLFQLEIIRLRALLESNGIDWRPDAAYASQEAGQPAGAEASPQDTQAPAASEQDQEAHTEAGEVA